MRPLPAQRHLRHHQKKEPNPDGRKPLRVHRRCHLPLFTITFSSWLVLLNPRFFLEPAVARRLLVILDEEGLTFRLRPAALRFLRDFAFSNGKVNCLP